MTLKISDYKEKWLEYSLRGVMLGGIGLLMISLLSWQIPWHRQTQLEIGQVATSDVVAPRQISYVSQIRTERAREHAAQAVPDQYDSPEGRVRRQQVDRSREVLEFITLVRSDIFASPGLKTDYLSAIVDLELSQEIILQLLSLSTEEWSAVVEEIPLALGRIMREEIRESTVTIARRRVPTLVDNDLNDIERAVIAELVRDFIQPNSFLNEERTTAEREVARTEVPELSVELEQNEIIVRAGDIVTPEIAEALEQVGLLREEWDVWVVVRATLFSFTLMLATVGTLHRLNPQLWQSPQHMALLSLAVAIWLVAAKLMIIPHEWLPYLYPLATLGMLLAVLLDIQVAVVLNITFTFIVYYLGGNNMTLVAYVSMSGLFGALIMGRAERLTAFLWAGVAIMLSNLLTFVAFRAPFDGISTSELFQTLFVICLNGGISASIALIAYFFLGNLFGITTSLQLTELSRPTHPLFRQLLLKSPGTYHHTIVVSNLAERAAAAIGADAFLTRVGAYYHDIGKSVRPYFFVENEIEGPSPHDKLDPLTSAQIIISHVTEGINLAQKYKLPARIQDFIREHHGTSLMKFFYIQAQEQLAEGETLTEADFHYPGPKPQTKETAILMLADTCEAAVRAIRPATREDLVSIVNKLIDDRVADGDLNECNLTFKELQTTKEIFLHVLQGVHHPRIAYPKSADEKSKAEKIADKNDRTEQSPPHTMPPVPQPGSTPVMSQEAQPTAVPGGVEQPA